MANPQKENGHTGISNELLEAILSFGFNGTQHDIIWSVVRKTYGWSKKEDILSIGQISGMIKTRSRRGILEEMANLQKMKVLIITRQGQGLPNKIKLNKDYAQWHKVVKNTSLPKAAVNKNALVKNTSLSSKELVRHTSLPKTPVNKNTLVKNTSPEVVKNSSLVLVKNTSPTKERLKKRNKTLCVPVDDLSGDISSLIKKTKSVLSQETKILVEEYLENARYENKSKKITRFKELRLCNELEQFRAKYGEKLLKHGLTVANNKQVANENYVKKVILTAKRKQETREEKKREEEKRSRLQAARSRREYEQMLKRSISQKQGLVHIKDVIAKLKIGDEDAKNQIQRQD